MLSKFALLEDPFGSNSVAIDISLSDMASVSACLADHSASLMAVWERTVKDMEDLHQRKVDEIKSILEALRESNSVICQLRAENRSLQRENAQLQQCIYDLNQRPEPLPCGMPELTRVALDHVRKWDSDARVDEQKKEICRLREKVKLLKAGHITMGEFWRRFQENNLVEFVPEESLMPEYNPDESIFAFMRRLIIEIQDAEDEEEGEFGFSSLLPRIDSAFGGYIMPDNP